MGDACNIISENVRIISSETHTIHQAVNNVLDKYKTGFPKIAKICVILGKQIFMQALRYANLNQPLVHNETRWNSACNEIERVIHNLDQI